MDDASNMRSNEPYTTYMGDYMCEVVEKSYKFEPGCWGAPKSVINIKNCLKTKIFNYLSKLVLLVACYM